MTTKSIIDIIKPKISATEVGRRERRSRKQRATRTSSANSSQKSKKECVFNTHKDPRRVKVQF